MKPTARVVASKPNVLIPTGAFVLLWLWAWVIASAQTPPSDATSAYDAAIAQIKIRSEAAARTHASNTDVKIWPGVVADRRAKTVTIMACATGLKRTDPMEFYVTPVTSGKDYEALTVTPAKPSHVAAALTFIGLKPGLPIDAEKNRFWARGPRLSTKFIVGEAAVSGDAVMVDTRDGAPLSGDLIFAGSYTTTDAKDERHLAADADDGKAIAPTYEDPAAVLAVPRRAPQSAVYNLQKPAAETQKWTRGQSVDVVLTPIEPAQGEPAGPLDDPMATALTLRLRQADGLTLFDLSGPLVEAGGPTVHATLPSLVEQLESLTRRRPHDLFTRVEVDESVPVARVRNSYAVLSAIEKDRGIKIESPPSGTLYYRAFLPDDAWRDRATRLGEPWELFLSRSDGKLTARLERSMDNPDRSSVVTKVIESDSPADPAAFAAHVNDRISRWSRTIFIYPPADLTYGELMTWVRPVLATYPRVFVFSAEPPTTRPAR